MKRSIVWALTLLWLGAAEAATTKAELRQPSSRRLDQDEIEEILDPGSIVAQVPDDWDPEIRGGEPVEDPIPWLGTDNFASCTVVLVHADIVMTTASCAVPFRGAPFPTSVRIGSLRPLSGGTVVPVKGGQVHPDYDFDNPLVSGANIAVLQLNSSLTNTVALMNEDPMKPQSDFEILFVAGYGLVDDANFPDPDVLQGLFYFNVENCFDRDPFYRPDFHMCGDANEMQGACLGDSGSPAMEPGTRVVLGLAAYADAICEGQTINVYTRMSVYTPWVKQMICQMSANPPGFCAKDTTNDCIFGWFIDFLAALQGPYDSGKGY